MIPEGWKVIELQSMVTIKRGGSPRPIQEYLSKTGLRWLKYQMRLVILLHLFRDKGAYQRIWAE